ncbi:hypothetical protein MAR_013938 [Mya arenaria]|uniref:Uncharacterized protein n=1 Tax=Mya arenaria TaxID=6604 RepID=A0ABY7G4K5_MYAAR|nr:hypothetical protein MAR_013938 [Mya arenaria]
MEETSKGGDLSNHTSCSVNEEKSASERDRGKKRKATTETKLTQRCGRYVRMYAPRLPEDNKRKGTPSALPDGPRSGVEPVPTDDVPDGVEKPLSGLPDANLRKPKQ